MRGHQIGLWKPGHVSLGGSYMGVVHSNISSVCSLNVCTFLYMYYT